MGLAEKRRALAREGQDERLGGEPRQAEGLRRGATPCQGRGIGQQRGRESGQKKT